MKNLMTLTFELDSKVMYIKVEVENPNNADAISNVSVWI